MDLESLKFNKIIQFTDIHFGKKANSKVHNQDCLDFIDWMIEIIKKDDEIDSIAFLGDFFENRNAINTSTLNYALEGLEKLDALGLPILFIIGNHDLYHRDSRSIHAPKIFKNLKNVVLIEEPVTIDNCFFAPYLFEKEYETFKEQMNSAEYAFGHFEFKGFVLTGLTNVMKHGPDHTDFSNIKTVFSGHFHKRQIQDNIIYIGNTFPMDFGDSGDENRGVCLLDRKKEKIDFIDWPDHPRYLRCNLSDVTNGQWLPQPKMRVQVQVDEDITYSDALKLKEELMDTYELREFTMKGSAFKDIGDDEEDDVEEEISSVNELVIGLIEGMEKVPNIDNSILADMYARTNVDATSPDDKNSGNVKLLGLKLRNFISFGNNLTEIDLSEPGTYHIMGQNYDVESQNGCGKSTIFNAISYALYDKTLSSISKSKLMNSTNAKTRGSYMEVILSFMIGNDKYEIARSNGKEYNIRLVKNDDYENPITPDSIAETNKFLERLVGLSFELFKRTVVFRGKEPSFFELGAGKQRDVIEELFKIVELSQKAESLKDEAKEVDKKIAVEQAVINQLEAQHEQQKSLIDSTQSNVDLWEEQRSVRVQNLKADLETLRVVDFDDQTRRVQDRIDVQAMLDSASDDLAVIAGEVDRMLSENETYNKELVHLEDNNCPYCLQKYSDAEAKVDQLKEAIAKNTETISSFYEAVEALQSDININELNLDEINHFCQFNTIDEINILKDQLARGEEQIKLAENEANPHKIALDQIIESVGGEIDYDKLDELKLIFEHQKFLIKLLTDKNSFIRKKIINRNVPLLNKRLKEYLSDMGLPHSVRFLPELKAEIAEHDRFLDYGNLSGGEQKRVDLSLSYAFRDVMQHMHSKFSTLFIDEIDGGSVDSTGVDAMIKLAKRKADSDSIGIWVISHRPEVPGKLDRTFTVVKESGFSSFEEGAIEA